MKTNSFETQYPGYDLIPEKRSKWLWPLTWLAFAAFLIGVPALIFSKLSYDVPTPLVVGANPYTVPTVRQMAIRQYQEKKPAEAMVSFEKYFALGGREADMMVLYAYTLSQAGRKSEARQWSRKALATDPNSKAARMMSDALK